MTSTGVPGPLGGLAYPSPSPSHRSLSYVTPAPHPATLPPIYRSPSYIPPPTPRSPTPEDPNDAIPRWNDHPDTQFASGSRVTVEDILRCIEAVERLDEECRIERTELHAAWIGVQSLIESLGESTEGLEPGSIL